MASAKKSHGLLCLNKTSETLLCNLNHILYIECAIKLQLLSSNEKPAKKAKK